MEGAWEGMRGGERKGGRIFFSSTVVVLITTEGCVKVHEWLSRVLQGIRGCLEGCEELR